MPVFEFEKLKELFKNSGFHVYMIGGTSRDFLLGKEIVDFDFVTDATPDEMSVFIPKLDITFSKFGTCKLLINDKKIDLTSLREEGEYTDSRHPSYIKFVKDINIDYKRRDFTINAIYIDENYDIIDPTGGLNDLKNKILRCIGEPNVRLKEDPLRIVRALRFAKVYDLKIEENLEKAIMHNYHLINVINPAKIVEENKKEEKAKKIFGAKL